jgi:hypothetical protein
MAPLLARLGLGRSGFGFSKKSGGAVNVVSATGGTVLTPGNGFKYHTFTSPGTFTVSSGSANMDILIVSGGGGGGAGYYTGGGGAGGVVYGPLISTVSGSYPVVVGPGGPGGLPFAGTAGDGTPSSFDIVTAIGGGGGGSGPGGPTPNPVGRSGGSAGGSGYYAGPPSGVTPQPVPGLYTAYGNDAPYTPNIGNGGGGADGTASGRNAGAGKPFPGFEYPIVGLTPIAPVANSPTNNHYGGGGSGGFPGSNIVGGAGGGGYGTTGGTDPSPTITANAASNTGGGGGGRGVPNGSGGSGGSGVVIIRYQV